jgi:hypothetical protein
MKSPSTLSDRGTRLALRLLAPAREILARPSMPRILEFGCRVALVAGVLCAAWLTLRPTGNLPAWGWLPAGIARWVNRHGELRNLPAYFLLSVPALALAPAKAAWRAIVGVAVLAALLEFAQLGIRSRQFDAWDIVLSWLGVGFACANRAAWRRVGAGKEKAKCSP